MMEELNKLVGGVNVDHQPSEQPKNTARIIKNLIPVTKDGNTHSLTNEDGTIDKQVEFPDGFTPIGNSILNNEIIVILCSSEGNSQIGVIKPYEETNGVIAYESLAPVDSNGNVLSNNSELGFSLDHPVDCVSRKIIDGSRILYYTDNNVPFGQVNLDSPPVEGSVKETTKLIQDQKIPDINYISTNDASAGQLRPGVVQFVTRYISESGTETTFGIPSNPIPITKSIKNDGVDKYEGAYYDSGTVAKTISISIDDIDQNFSELEIFAITFKGELSVFSADRVARLPISSESIEYTYTGILPDDTISLTEAEITRVPISYKYAKCVEQKDNRLFFSNLRSEKIESDLQSIANNISVSYDIELMPFCNRGSNSTKNSSYFGIINSPTASGQNISMSFNDDLSDDNSTSNFLLNSNGTPAVGKIVVSDYTLISDGDPVNIDTEVFNAVNTIVNPNDFLIGSSNEETATNLLNAIGNVGSSDFSTSIDVDELNLTWFPSGSVGNSKVISAGSGFTVTTFAGGSNTVSTTNPDSISINGNNVTLSFSVDINLSDTIDLINIKSTDGSVYNESEANISSELDVNPVVPVNQQFSDYIDEGNCFYKKTYRRDEVYSFGFALLYNDGSVSQAFHIPGNNKSYSSSGRDNLHVFADGGLLGTYRSDQEYPQGQNYPSTNSGYNDSNIRHHYMPSNEDEPMFEVSGEDVNIRLIKLKFEFNDLIPDEILKDVKEVLFLREKRDSSNKKSMLSQGIFNRLAISADLFKTHDRGEKETGYLEQSGILDGYNKNYTLIQVPFFDKMTSITLDSNSDENYNNNASKGFVFPTTYSTAFPPRDKVLEIRDGAEDIDGEFGYAGGTKLSSEINKSQGFFLSPESILAGGNLLSSGDVSGSTLDLSYRSEGDIEFMNRNSEKWRGQDGGHFAESYCSLDAYLDLKTNKNDSSAVLSYDIQDSQYVKSGEYRADKKLDSTYPKVSTRWNQGGLNLRLTTDLNTTGNENDSITKTENPFLPRLSNDRNASRFKLTDSSTVLGSNVNDEPTGGNYIFTRKDGIEDPLSGSLTFSDYDMFIYNIKKDIANQYGTIDLSEYIVVSKNNAFESNGNFRTVYSEIYGGDTFITKFSVDQAELIPRAMPYEGGNDNCIFHTATGSGGVNSQRKNGYANDKRGPYEGNVDRQTRAYGHDFRWSTYFFVESDINTYYRHKDETLEDTTTDFYPNNTSNDERLESWYPYLGNIADYNTQYSKENDIRKFYTSASTSKVISSFENRTIYSDQAANDDVLDAYRSFAVNNYYDLPSESGPIWDSFIHANTFYLHTTKSLWRTFAEPSATLKGANIDDIVLGTGNLFARPSTPMITSNGGYAGTISQFGGSHSQYGYLFPDVLQGKIFLLSDSLEEISREGMYSFFDKNLISNIDISKANTEEAYLIDNPYSGLDINNERNGINISCGYDYKLKRFIITHLSGGFTYSYFPGYKAWFEHSYNPNSIIAFDNRTFFINSNKFYEMNVGPKCSYFDTIYDSEIEFVANQQHNQSKTFNNLQIWSETKSNNVKVKNNNFKDIRVYNDYSNSGTQPIVNSNGYSEDSYGEVRVKFVNDRYNISIPRDFVKDNSLDIEDLDNLYTPIGTVTPSSIEDFMRERIKGDHAIIKMTYDNVSNYEFVLKYVITVFNLNQR